MPPLASYGANANARLAPIEFVITDSQGPAGVFKKQGRQGPVVVEMPRQTLQRMAYLSGLVIVLSLMLAWHWSEFVKRRRRVSAIAPASILAAEQRSPELVSLVRTALVPKFTEWLNSHAAQQLILQRDGLRNTEEIAELELGKLEQLLIEVHAPLHERIQQYEQRIAELEEALRAKHNQGVEFIETMIRLTRQKIETEREAETEPAAP